MISRQAVRPASGIMMPSSKENVPRSSIVASTASSRPATATYAPTNVPQSIASAPVENQYIEHHKRDARGGYVTKRYLKGALLGKGGFAKCYRLIDTDTNEEWACKVVAKASLTKQRHKAKLQTEIKIHKGLSHKHVVRFEEVFEDKENVYIVMELCTHQTLLELVKRKKRLTEQETRRFMLQMLEGVKYMHNNKVIHRDLKLGNLFLGRHEEIKIGDFGLACKLAFDGERKRTLCGTPNYIAPEVLEGKNGHSYEVDTWSIGVVFYTCLVGKPPFETADVKSTYKLIKSNTYSFPDRIHLTDQAKNLIRRILQSDPERRPTTDEILLDDFFLGEGAALVSAYPQPCISSSVTNKPLSTATGILSNNNCDNYRVPLKPISANDDATTKKYLSDNKYENKPASDKYDNKFTSEWSRPSSGALSERDTPSTAAPSALGRNITSSETLSSAPGAPNVIPRTTMSSLLSRPASAENIKPANTMSSNLYDLSSKRTTATTTSSATAWAPPTSATSSAAVESRRDRGGALDLTPTKQLAKAISALDLRKSSPPKHKEPLVSARESDAAALAGVPNDGEDQQALYVMHLNIKQCVGSAKSDNIGSSASNLPLPSVWVSRWVDYSKKYGLGYKLSNGCSGVFFNDATKMLLSTDGEALSYIERLRRDDASKYDEKKQHRLSAYPTELTKKVTLMEHFKNYLDETHPNRDSPLHVPPKSDEGLFGRKRDASEVSHEGVYVRKWMRTRHSIIFRLSNNNFQVNFFDDTEVLLWSDKRYVTYKGKNKVRATYDLSDMSAVPELAKRIKYVTDILSQLVSRT